jgi:hypothetical protein
MTALFTIASDSNGVLWFTEVADKLAARTC